MSDPTTKRYRVELLGWFDLDGECHSLANLKKPRLIEPVETDDAYEALLAAMRLGLLAGLPAPLDVKVRAGDRCVMGTSVYGTLVCQCKYLAWIKTAKTGWKKLAYLGDDLGEAKATVERLAGKRGVWTVETPEGQMILSQGA